MENDLENLIRLLATIAADRGRGLVDFRVRVHQNGSGTFELTPGEPIGFVGPNTFAEQIRTAAENAK